MLTNATLTYDTSYKISTDDLVVVLTDQMLKTFPSYVVSPIRNRSTDHLPAKEYAQTYEMTNLSRSE